jgi:hypothetical protein
MEGPIPVSALIHAATRFLGSFFDGDQMRAFFGGTPCIETEQTLNRGGG